MVVIQQLLLFLFASLVETNLLQTKTSVLHRNTNYSTRKITSTNASIVQTENIKISPVTSDSDVKTDEIHVNDLLETVEQPDVISIPQLHHGPHYELDWSFIDKDTIRVVFDLFSVPTSLIENNIYSDTSERRLNLLAIMATMPSRTLKSITSLQYFVYIIRPYNQNREILLKMETLHLKNTTLKPYLHFSNTLYLTALNHKEKYSVCISYYQTNSSRKPPDLLLCQDIINDYLKFSELRTDPKHGLLFITTQYSIILALLVVLQSVFTMRKRHTAQSVVKHLATTAHSIRSTLSSVSLVRQSFSSLDAAAEPHQQQTISSHVSHREPTINEESRLKKRIISSPAIVLSAPPVSTDNDINTADETEPFLKRTTSKNHVHFLLGPSEEDDDGRNEVHDSNTTFNLHPISTNKELHSDQTDAELSMAHILDTNKPWSRHGHDTSPV